MRDDSGNDFTLGLILGAAIGIAIGILYAPTKGSETRAMLKDKASELSDKADELADKVKHGAAVARQNLEPRLPATE